MTQKIFSGGLFTLTHNALTSSLYLGLYCRHITCLHKTAFPNTACSYIIHPWIESKIDTCINNYEHALLLPEHLQGIKNLLKITKDTNIARLDAIKTYLESVGYVFLPEESIKDIVQDRFRALYNYDFLQINEMQNWSNFSKHEPYLKDKYILLKIEAHKKKTEGIKLTLLSLGHVQLSAFISNQLNIKQGEVLEPTSLNIKSVKLLDPLKYKPLGVYF